MLPETQVVEAKYAAELALVSEHMGSDAWRKLDELEVEMGKLPPQEMPLDHVFTTGLYTRSIFMPKGSLLTTRIHLTEHPFVISAGVVSVWDDVSGWVTLRASHIGVTTPGTRRLLYVHEDCIWSTFHLNPTDESDPDKLVMDLTYVGGKYSTIGSAAAAAPTLEPSKESIAS